MPATKKPRVSLSFDKKRPIADGMTSYVAALSHDVPTGVSLPSLFVGAIYAGSHNTLESTVIVLGS